MVVQTLLGVLHDASMSAEPAGLTKFLAKQPGLELPRALDSRLLVLQAALEPVLYSFS